MGHRSIRLGNRVDPRSRGQFQNIPNRYQAATRFNIKCTYPNGAEILFVDDKSPVFDTGLLIEGTEGRIFLNRVKLTGKPVDAMKDNPLPDDALARLSKGQQPGDHMHNFME